ncbi:MAG: hypothetical protein AAF985_17810 [Bacteroidota bacterium]
MMLTCELCKRETKKTTKHHLIPRTLHRNKWFKKNFSSERMHQTVNLCRDCHKEIHRQIPEKEMGRHFNSLELLLTHEKVAKYVVWISKSKS